MTDWELTAELGQPIFPEAIVDGTKNKVGGHATASIGAEILKYFVCLPSVTPPIFLLADYLLS
jgi:hypothetical protein